ncbi:hypothetical protein ACP70R_045102 [Stipagrostis hirtigluma subsp. patula]
MIVRKLWKIPLIQLHTNFDNLLSNKRMSGHLQHRPRPSISVQGAPSNVSSTVNGESIVSSASTKTKRKRTGIGNRLPEQERPYITPVGDEWEVHPYSSSRKPSTIMGALARIFYPDMIGPKENRRPALTWEDYKWSPDRDTPPASACLFLASQLA